jgi:hypothetical protein
MGNELAVIRGADDETALDLPRIEDDLLEEKYKDVGELAAAFGKPLGEMRRLLATPAIFEKLMEISRRAGLVELNMVEVPMLKDIIAGNVASTIRCSHCGNDIETKTAPTPRLRAAKRLREILEGKKGGPSIVINNQQNNVTPGQPGFIDQKILERSQNDK